MVESMLKSKPQNEQIEVKTKYHNNKKQLEIHQQTSLGFSNQILVTSFLNEPDTIFYDEPEEIGGDYLLSHIEYPCSRFSFDSHASLFSGSQASSFSDDSFDDDTIEKQYEELFRFKDETSYFSCDSSDSEEEEEEEEEEYECEKTQNSRNEVKKEEEEEEEEEEEDYFGIEDETFQDLIYYATDILNNYLDEQHEKEKKREKRLIQPAIIRESKFYDFI
ncbi:hypothetical protein G9A89_002186 [Geosiphon pyriformis]|nr:hypothetical protein G9A89_002186 [Geosiphon pyriformis]